MPTIVVEFLLTGFLAILFGSLEWQIIRGNSLVRDTKESLNDIRRQQNENAQILQDKLNSLLKDINNDIEKAANNNYMLSQNLSSFSVKIDGLLSDLRQTNLQLLARIEVLDKKVENGHGHSSK